MLKTDHSQTNEKLNELNTQMINEMTRVNEINDLSLQISTKMTASPNGNTLAIMGVLGVVIGLFATVFAIDAMIRHVTKQM